MRRLRDIAESVREQLAGASQTSFLGDGKHALVQDVKDIQVMHRPVISGAKRHRSIPWLSYSFTPFLGLIEPFNIYPGRYWAFQQIHKQPSGLPELVTHISKEFPGASEALEPHLYTGFSNSPNIEVTVDEVSSEPLTYRFYHSGSLCRADRTVLPAEYCVPGIEQALPEAFIDDDVPGVFEPGGPRTLYLGELTFYNQGRTPDKAKLRHFLFNNAGVAVVLRYVRDAVSKAIAQEDAG